MELPVIRLGKYIKISLGICYLLCVLFIILSCKLIWTDEEIVIAPKTEKIFVAELDFLGFNLTQGRYRIEKEISILEKGKNSQIDSSSPTGNRSIETEFVIK